MTNFFYTFFLFLLSSIFTTSVYGQVEDSVSAELNRLKTLFFEKESEFQTKKDTAVSKELLQKLSVFRSSLSFDTTSFNDDYYDARAALLKKEWGLSGRVDALQNFNPSFNDVEESILYQRRYQVGLEWDILKDGYLDKRLELKSIPAQKAYYEYVEHYQNSIVDFGPKMNECLYFFNRRKIQLLEQRKALLTQQVKSAYKLLALKKITRENVLQIQTRIAETQGMFNIYSSYNINLTPGHDSLFYALDAPLFDLNYSFFFDQLQNGMVADSIVSLLKTASESQRKWYNDIGLKAYGRYNYYDLLNTASSNSRAFFSVGVTARVPLPFTTKEQKSVDQANLLRREHELKKQQSDKRLDILNEAYEFRYQLKQYVIFHQKKILQLEALRRERVKSRLSDADFNPQHGIELLDNILQIDIEMLDLKQNLYLRLLRIHDKQSEVAIKDMIVPMELPNFIDIEDQTEKGMYVWSKAFADENIHFIEEYLIYNSIDRIYLAVTEEDSARTKKIELAKSLTEHGIQVELMVGKNKLISSSTIAEEIAKLIKDFPKDSYTSIHLDIEPHTLPEYKKNKYELLDLLVQRVKEMKVYCKANDLKLSIDIPLHYPDTIVYQLIEIVDRIHFMCYENVKADYLIRKLSLFKASASKLSVALRAEDFANRVEIEKLSQEIRLTTTIKNIDYHDFSRFVKLDKTTLSSDAKY
jgi:hypothetical protein